MKRVVAALKENIKKSGLLPSFKVRERLAAKYLHGTGLEIGALHFPQEVPRGVVVKYVDYATREENIDRFPEVPASKVVTTDHIDNGFELASFPACSQDFIIANHVLEHADNPIRVLVNWGRFLRPQGVLMVTVPIAERCFDKGRQETTLEHFVEDYRLMEAGEISRFRDRNREHFMEFLTISEPNAIRNRGGHVAELTQAELDTRLAELCAAERVDLHFHTFSVESYRKVMEYFVTASRGEFGLMEIRGSRGGAEIVAVVKKLK